MFPDDHTKATFTDGLQSHDYVISTHKMYKHYEIRWLDKPGLIPSDIRARRFTSSTSFDQPKAHNRKIVWRSVHNCNGSCQHGHTSSGEQQDMPNNDVDQELFDLATARIKLKSHDGSRPLSWDKYNEPKSGNESAKQSSGGGDQKRKAVQGKICSARLIVRDTR
jgi:hypothetical protein